MIKHKLYNYYRKIWTFKQPLTKIPRDKECAISDLFIWRNSVEWKTFFELFDVYSLFKKNTLSNHVTLVFFDKSGIKISEQKIFLDQDTRKTLDISSRIGNINGEIGTFSVFHSSTPSELSNIGSFITERGYTSYQFKNSPLRSYVHGNFDAISKHKNGSLELIGGHGFLKREYNLQYQIQPYVKCELGMVNPTSSEQKFVCKILSLKTGQIINTQTKTLSPRGVDIFTIEADRQDPARIIIESHLVMARPTVFKISNNKMDVFHG